MTISKVATLSALLTLAASGSAFASVGTRPQHEPTVRLPSSCSSVSKSAQDEAQQRQGKNRLGEPLAKTDARQRVDS